MPVFREHHRLRDLGKKDEAELKQFALENQTDQQGRYRPVLSVRNGRLYAGKYVGVIETRGGTVLEILPKVDFVDDDEESTRMVFLRMLRTYRGLRAAQFKETGISELRDFNMLDLFVKLFLTNLVLLTQRGLARQYRSVEDNLPWLRGRIQFPQHIRRNAVNRARFHVAFDEFTADRPENRLIHSAIHKLQLVTHPDNHQLLHQLRICFSDVPRSARPEVDWERHRIDRSMRHYDTVMAWVGLFLFHHGLATLSGRHVNQALLFPMEEVFEDFVSDAFRRHQRIYGIRTQGPKEAFAGIDGRDAFHMKPDIALVRSSEVQFVLDAKWKKEVRSDDKDAKHGVIQDDIYQLYSYGRKFGCGSVALIYPRTRTFDSPLRYEFKDKVAGQGLTLFCFPFDVVQPEKSVREIMQRLAGQ